MALVSQKVDLALLNRPLRLIVDCNIPTA